MSTITACRRRFLLASGALLAAPMLGSAQRVGPAFQRVKALAFDSYGSLFDVTSLNALCEEIFPGHGKQLSELWRRKQLQYSQMRSMMNRYRDFWQLTDDALVHATNTLKLNPTASQRTRLTEAYLTLPAYPDVKPAMTALRNQGVRLALLSNGTPTMLAAIAQHAGIDKLLEALISVDPIRVFKPDPRVYQLGLKRMKLPANALGFVSSHSWDVNGAASAGLPTIWVPRMPAEAADELGFHADTTLGAMTDIAPLLRG